ncbi:magnesium transporter [Candidatus Gracilibacteria bacterium]|nr:magnesium transporter [Candidatus Gracilibacteria bacterium]
MVYLSQLIGTKIVDSKQEIVGKVKDVVAATGEKKYPYVIGVVFKNGKELNFIPYETIETMGPSGITLNRFDCYTAWDENPEHLFLNRDVMDEQIFDVEGIRVVRVNDLQLAKVGEFFNLVGIDVSNKALVRRLGLAFLPLIKLMQTRVIDWHSVNFIQGRVGSIKLNKPFKKLEKLHPADIANLIENLTLHQSTKVVQSLRDEKAAAVIAEMEPKYKDTLLEKINPKNLARIMEELPTDEAADVLQDLSEHKRLQVFRRLGERKAKVINKLAKYRSDVAGGLMTADFMNVHPDSRINDAIEEIRKKSEEYKSIYHVFVINDKKFLKGIVSIRTLLLADKHLKVEDVMSKVFVTVKPTTDYEELAVILTRYNLLSVAVVDKQGRMKGIVTIDDVMRLLVPHA